MKLEGRAINPQQVSGEALVLEVPFSFIGDFDPKSGRLTMAGHPLAGQSLAGKVLVFPLGRGGTVGPLMAYEAKANGQAPAAILCDQIDPLTCECALIMGIPILDLFSVSPARLIKTGDLVAIDGDQVAVQGKNAD